MKFITATTLLCLLCLTTNAQVADSTVLVNDTVVQKGAPFSKTAKVLGIAIPATMITYGVISVTNEEAKDIDTSTRDELTEDNSFFYNGADDYLQFAPAVAAFTLKACGVESKHKLSDMVILYALSNLVESGVVVASKNLVGRQRPDGSAYNSFPSGHTATAFVAAEFLHQEYGHKSIWISVGGYTMASIIGLSRIYNNRHWVSDVITGAGVGILSTKGVYWLYPKLQKAFGCESGGKDKPHAFVMPSYYNGTYSLNFAYTF